MRHLGLLIICVILSVSGAAASNQGGTETPFVFGAGARELGMGGAGTAGSASVVAAFWNPSLLARAEQYCFGGFHSQFYESDVAYQYLGAVAPTLDLGTLGFGVFRLGVNDIERRDAANLLTGQFDDNRLMFLLAYGRTVSGYDLGMALSMEHHSVDNLSATSSPGLSLALSRRIALERSWLRSMTLAVNGRNLVKPGSDLAGLNVKQPTALEVGLELKLVPKADWNQSLTLDGAMRKVEDLKTTVSAGLEYNLYQLLYLRGGVRDSRLSFGAGLEFRSLRFDYALVDRDLGSLHMFTLTTSFGKSVSQRREDRTHRREAAFNATMNQRLNDRTQGAVASLVREGETLLADRQYDEAGSRFDRALFLARSAGLDTTQIDNYLRESRARSENQQRSERLRVALDQAAQNLATGDYLSARHYAELALVEDSASDQARGILRQAESALAKAAARDTLIRTRLAQVDSMLSYGHVAGATEAIGALRQFDQDPGVHSAIKRVEFEHWKDNASAAFAQGDFSRAQAAVDSALVRFPGHQWCVDMKRRIADESVVSSRTTPATAETPPSALSVELQKEVDAANRDAQKEFKEGNLQAAISLWERIERLAPNYQSVRTYLVNAYKYVGVELYGRNQLSEAVTVWRKAAGLAPDNTEIRDYIRRTETEITRLNELTYDK